MNLSFELQIKKTRISMGISQKELAKKSRLSQSYIAKLESNNRVKSPTLNTLKKISKVLNVCPFFLVQCNKQCYKCKFFDRK